MSVRADFADSIRKVAAERKRLADPPPFDRHAFGALAAEVDRLLAAEDGRRAEKLIEDWKREQLRQVEGAAG